jgi:hypothetical protein
MTDRYDAISLVITGTGEKTVCTIDLGATHELGAIDIDNATLTADLVAGVLQARVSTDGAAWMDLGSALTLGPEARTRRISAMSGLPVTCRYVRLVVPDAAAVTDRTLFIGSLSLMSEADLSAGVFAEFTYQDTSAYCLLFSDQNAEVFLNGVRRASIAVPHTQGLLSRADFAQQLDTMLVFHEQTPPWRIFRQGSDEDWDSRALDFTGMRQAQFPGATYTNGRNEVQQLEFSDFETADTFNLTLDGETTDSITYSASMSASLKAAIEALDVIGDGTVTVAAAGGNRYRIEFTGDAGQTNWPELGPAVVVSNKGVAISATLTGGEEGGEDIVSAARGWPRTGKFAAGRLFMGGLRDLPQTVIASRLGEYFDFRAGGGRATDGLEFTVDSEDANGVRRMYAGRFILLYTASAEFYIGTDTIAADATLPIIPAGRSGTQFNILPREVDGAIVHIQKGGKVARELQYSEDARSYVGSSLSVRAPELVNRPVSAAARQPGYDNEDALYMLALEDGGISAFTSQREQDVAAWSRFGTDGKFIAVGSDSIGGGYCVTEREINGETRRYVEYFVTGRVLDCSIDVELDDATGVSGLDHLEGKQVWLYGEGVALGPYTVANGAISFARTVSGAYECGLFFDAWADTMDIRFQSGAGSVADTRRRIVAAAVSVEASAPPAITIQGRTYPFQLSDRRVLDQGPFGEGLVTGYLRLEGFTGWARTAEARIKRQFAGPMNLRSLKLEVVF